MQAFFYNEKSIRWLGGCFFVLLYYLKGRRVDCIFCNQHMKKKIIKIMLAVLFL